MDEIEKKIQNARFWEYINGDWVKLTLRPGQVKNWRCSGATEEGWSAETYQWYYDGPSATIFCKYMSDGVDCDGRLKRFWTGSFDITGRKWLDHADPTILSPDWHECSASQRDYVAELMGY